MVFPVAGFLVTPDGSVVDDLSVCLVGRVVPVEPLIPLNVVFGLDEFLLIVVASPSLVVVVRDSAEVEFYSRKHQHDEAR